MSLKHLAEDLDSFLAGLKKPETKIVTPNGSVTFTDAGSIKFGEDAAQIDAVVRAAFDYTTAQLKEDDDAAVIGEAFMLACGAVAKDAGLDHDKVQQHALAFLENIVESARSGP